MPDPITLVLMAAWALMGLHLPKTFTLFYAVLALLLWRSRPLRRPAAPLPLAVALLLLFGLSYALLSVQHGLWRLGGRDLLDLISMLLLPAGGLWVGTQAAGRLSWRQMAWLWLAYGLGALLYTWLVLLHGRVLVPDGHLLDLLRRSRDTAIPVPWGGEASMNVRSVEQNAALAAAWLLPGLALAWQGRQRRLGLLLCASGLAAVLASLCFHGRLGLLVAALGGAPLLLRLSPGRRSWRRGLAVLAGAGLALAAALLLRPRLGQRLLALLHDERFDRLAGFLSAAPRFPWGGNQLHFAMIDQQRQVLMTFDARQGELMHNVFCDVYVRVGWLPLLALVLALALCLPPALAQLRRALGSTEEAAPALLLAGVLITLAVQWLFQPLLYADGLLFFLGFLLLGFLAAGRVGSDNQADQARPPCPPRSRAT